MEKNKTYRSELLNNKRKYTFARETWTKFRKLKITILCKYFMGGIVRKNNTKQNRHQCFLHKKPCNLSRQ